VDLDHEPSLARVLIPLDGTELGEQILEPALALAGLMPGAEVTLLRVVRPPLPVPYLPDGVGAVHEAESLVEQVRLVQDRLRREAGEYLQGVSDRLRQRGLTVRTRVVVEDRPAVGILKEAEASRATLIALETHGRGALRRLLLGSTTDKII